MTTDLHTANINDLTFPDVVAFCSEQRPESIRLDYKEKWSSNNPGRQIAKEICAFANTRGGLLILGVEEDEERRDRPTPNPQGQELGPNPQHQILGACSSHIYPPLAPEVSRFLENPKAKGRGFVVVRVHQSRDVPHTTQNGQDIYVRVHDSSKPVERATIDQIDRMLEQRRTLVSLQEARVNRAIESMRRAIGIGQGDSKYLAVAISPIMPSEPLLTREQCWNILWSPAFQANRLIRTCSDGACGAALGKWNSLLLDMFGNAVVVFDLNSLLREVKPNEERLKANRLHDLLDRPEGEPLRAASTPEVIEAIPLALRLAEAVKRATASPEPVRVRLSAEGVNQVPLTSEISWDYGMEYAAYNAAESRLDISLEFEGLTSDEPDVGLLIAERLLWAWGSCEPGYAARVLDTAERSVYETEYCGCSRANEKAKFRSTCLRCRQEAASRKTIE